MFSGFFAGFSFDVLEDVSPFDKNMSACVAGYSIPQLQAINMFTHANTCSQWARYFEPFIPFLGALLMDIAINYSHYSKTEYLLSFFRGVASKITKENILFLTMSALLLEASWWLDGYFDLTGNIDPSGHMMIKVVQLSMSIEVMKVVRLTSATQNSSGVAFTLFTLEMIANLICMANTIAHCHTLAEIIQGILWGSAIVSLAHFSTYWIAVLLQSVPKRDVK